MKSSKDVVVSLKGVSKRYGDVTAVETLSLDVRRGELLCLLGPSGCGKTTTLRMVAGFVEPSDGAVVIDGQDMTREPPYRRDTGMVFQNYALFPHMTTAQNIAFGLENLKWAKADRDKRVLEMLTLVEMAHLSDRLPAQLSGGQQQRVALARALAMRPAVLLLDEPFSNLDAQLRVRMREEIRDVIRRVEITTIFVTHDQEEALMLSDRIGVMNKGKLEQVGTPADIYERPASRFVAQFVGWCSLLDGTVDTNGNFVSTRGLAFKSSLPPGAATAVIRPEHVKARDPDLADARPTYTAKVITSDYYGGISRLLLRVCGEQLMMEGHFPQDRRPRVGDEVAIALETAQIPTVPAAPP
jgi:putative spermidine/putrescine transport system ATP-binding protein